MRKRGARFVRSEVRSLSGEIVVDIGKSSPGVHRRRAGTQSEVKVSLIVKLGRIDRTRRGYPLKNVVVNQDAVLVMAGGRAELLKGLEFSHFRVIDAVVEVGHVIISDDVLRAVYFDRIFRRQLVWKIR